MMNFMAGSFLHRLVEGVRLCRQELYTFAEKTGPERKVPDIVRKET
jgi:hypothetical protein